MLACSSGSHSLIVRCAREQLWESLPHSTLCSRAALGVTPVLLLFFSCTPPVILLFSSCSPLRFVLCFCSSPGLLLFSSCSPPVPSLSVFSVCSGQGPRKKPRGSPKQLIIIKLGPFQYALSRRNGHFPIGESSNYTPCVHL